MPDLTKYMRQTIQVEPRTGTDSFGKATYGAAVNEPARYVEKQQLVRNASGSEIMSTAEVMMSREPKIGDRINGRAVQNRASIVGKDGVVLGWRAYL